MLRTYRHTLRHRRAPAVLLGALLALSLCAVLLLTPGRAQAASSGFAVSPLRVNMSLDAGASKKQSIEIRNSLAKRTTFTVHREDFSGSRTDPNAAPVLLGGEVDSSISGTDWLEPNVSSFTLDPQEERTITVTVTAPASATGGHYAALIVSTPAIAVSGDISARSEVAVLFMMNAGSVPPPELVIDEVTVTEDGETIIDYVNNGQTDATPDVKVIYRDPVTGRTVSSGTGSCRSTTLPGSAGRCVLNGTRDSDSGVVSPLREGEVVLTSDGRRARAEVPVEWSGSGGAWLLPLVGLGLLVLYFARVRRRQEDAGSP